MSIDKCVYQQPILFKHKNEGGYNLLINCLDKLKFEKGGDGDSLTKKFFRIIKIRTLYQCYRTKEIFFAFDKVRDHSLNLHVLQVPPKLSVFFPS